MLAYVLKLALMLPLVGGMAWGALWLWRKAEAGLSPAGGGRTAICVTDALPFGAAGRIAVVEFDGQRLLVGVSRAGFTLLSRGERDGERGGERNGERGA